MVRPGRRVWWPAPPRGDQVVLLRGYERRVDFWQPAAMLCRMTELATIVATVELPEGVTPDDLRAAVADALSRAGARTAPCGWAPDPDTVAEQCGVDTVAVVDLSPVPA